MIALLLAPSASAWTWDYAEAPLADGMTIHLCENDFAPELETQIRRAAGAWQAGTGRVLPGALWTYTWGADRPDGTCGPGNGYDEVHAEDEDWFADHDAAGVIATTMNDDAAVDAEVDFVFNLALAGMWTDRKPNRAGDDQISLGMVALHELGHGLGFNHDNTFVAVMNSSYPNGGDLGGEYHPSGDDYAAIVAERPDPSEGKNLLLGKFVADPTDPGDSFPVWAEADERWTVCQDEVAASAGPEAITGVVHETSGALQPLVVWQVSADTDCFDGVEYEVGRAVPELATGAPYELQPDGYDFRAVPEGEYTLCAKIDADAAIAETHESDNSVKSKARLTVEACD